MSRPALRAIDACDRVEVERIAADAVDGVRRKDDDASAQNDARNLFGDELERLRSRIDLLRRVNLPGLEPDPHAGAVRNT